MISTFAQSLRACLTQLYEDQCDIFDYKEKENVDGSTHMTLALKQSQVPCRLSRISNQRSAQTDQLPQTQIQEDMRLYFSEKIDIRDADVVEITHRNTKQRFQVIRITRYESHTECTVQRVVET